MDRFEGAYNPKPAAVISKCEVCDDPFYFTDQAIHYDGKHFCNEEHLMKYIGAEYKEVV